MATRVTCPETGVKPNLYKNRHNMGSGKSALTLSIPAKIHSIIWKLPKTSLKLLLNKYTPSMDKDKRHQDIKKLIQGRTISSQEELLEALKNQGYELTQATLSRDLKELGIAKVPDNEKGYVYVLPEQMGMAERMTQSLSMPAETILSIEFSYNFGILKTLPGFANSIAIFIDSCKLTEVAGTIAGDDTILIIPREPHTQANVKTALQRIFPKIAL
jgi:transcriptional regulator of arginine metabolism